MVVKLRNTLNEKSTRFSNNNDSMSSSLDEKQSKKAKENEDVINKAIKMVILNTALSILFKIPFVFIPIVNVIAGFYYKDRQFAYDHAKFGRFYGALNSSGMYVLIPILYDFFYTVFISFQLFIFVSFDKKIASGFDRIFSLGKQSSQK